MKLLSKLVLITLTLYLGILPVGLAFAASSLFQFRVSNTSGTDYSMVSVMLTSNTTGLVARGSISSTGLDTRVLNGTVPVPHMLVDNRTVVAIPTNTSSNTTLTFTSGNIPLSSFKIIPGSNGYITTANSSDTELISSSVYSDTLVTSGPTVDIGWWTGRTSTIQSDGTYWILYSSVPAADTELWASKSTDGGTTWSSELVVASPGFDYGADSSNLVVDSNDVLHVIYSVYDTVLSTFSVGYKQRVGGIWSGETLIGNGAILPTHSGAMGVDSQDNVHLVYEEISGLNYYLVYKYWDGSVWSAGELVVEPGVVTSYYGTIAITSDDAVNLLYNKYTGALWFKQRSPGGVWGPEEVVTSGDISYLQIQMAVDSIGDSHVIWYGQETGLGGDPYRVKYCKRASGVWGVVEELSDVAYSDDNEDPGISVRKNDTVDVFWPDYNGPTAGLLLHRENSGSGWSVLEVLPLDLTVGVDGADFPSPIWATFPVIGGVHTNIPEGYEFFYVNWPAGDPQVRFYKTPLGGFSGWTVESSGYIDTTKVGALLVEKGIAFSTNITATGELTSTTVTAGIEYSVVATGVTSGLHIVTTSLSSGTLGIYVDGILMDSLDGVADPLVNTSNWTWISGNSMVYANYLSVSVNGIEHLRYKPVNIISGNTLPDISSASNNTGVITWGVNLGGLVAVVYGGDIPVIPPPVVVGLPPNPGVVDPGVLYGGAAPSSLPL